MRWWIPLGLALICATSVQAQTNREENRPGERKKVRQGQGDPGQVGDERDEDRPHKRGRKHEVDGTPDRDRKHERDQKGDRDRELRRLMACFAEDGSGRLNRRDRARLKRFLAELQRLRAADLERKLQQFDANGDGKLDAGERAKADRSLVKRDMAERAKRRAKRKRHVSVKQ